MCCTCRRGECLYPVYTWEGGENGKLTHNKESPYLFQQYKRWARSSVSIQFLRDIEIQTTRTAASPSAPPCLGQPPSSGGEGPTAPSVFSQFRLLQVRPPRLHSEQGYRAFLELGGIRQAPIVLTPSLIPTLALHLPKLCEHLVWGEYNCNKMFRMQTVAGNG
jgi:hypothetical protein